MQVPVLIELLPEGFRATVASPFGVIAEGKSRDAVLQKVRQLIEQKLSMVFEVVQLDIPIPENPWLRMAGIWDPADPEIQEWIQVMKENRQKDDAELYD